jgi:hypothetical protein
MCEIAHELSILHGDDRTLSAFFSRVDGVDDGEQCEGGETGLSLAIVS